MYCTRGETGSRSAAVPSASRNALAAIRSRQADMPNGHFRRVAASAHGERRDRLAAPAARVG